MLARLRARLTYANVVATLALFLALSGASYAAIRIGSRSIINNSVRSQDLRNNDIRSRDIRQRTIQAGDILTDTITGHQVRESTLGTVPNADKLDGFDSSSFRLACPADTQRFGGGCIETSSRPAATFDVAARTCGSAGRRLPTVDELASFSAEPGITLSTFEFTGTRLEPNVETVSDGPAYLTAPASSATRAYRCVAPLTN